MTSPTRSRPQAVEVTSWLLWALVAGGLAVAVFVAVDRHDLADQWSPLHPDDARVQPVSFVPVVLTLYVVIAGTALILIAMFRQAQAWARPALAVLELGTVAGSFAIMRTAPPSEVRWALFAAAVVAAAAFVFLWHPGVSRYLRDDAAHDDEAEDAPHERV